jgi:hypothetical protein
MIQSPLSGVVRRASDAAFLVVRVLSNPWTVNHFCDRSRRKVVSHRESHGATQGACRVVMQMLDQGATRTTYASATPALEIVMPSNEPEPEK